MRLRSIIILSLLSVCVGCAENRNGTAKGLAGAAPDFSLHKLDGTSFSSAELKGKVAVIDFWATWCPGCQLSLPHLQKLANDQDRLAHGLTLVAINEGETSKMIRDYVDQNHYTFLVLKDLDQTVGMDYQAMSLPTTIIIGRDGMIRARLNGWTEVTGQRVDQEITAALNATTQPSTLPDQPMPPTDQK